MAGRSPTSSRTVKEFFLFIFLMNNPYGLCQSHGSKLEQEFLPFPHPHSEIQASSFLWNASWYQLSKIVIVSRAQ